MVMQEHIKAGDQCYLVFKAQAFAPSANAATQTMDMILNVVSGIFRGDNEDGTFQFETESASGAGVLWLVKFDDILMLGARRDVPRLARV